MKRLRVVAAADLPNNFTLPGALRCELDGPVATVTLDDFQEHILDDLRTRWSADVAVEDLNLEEIFVALHERPSITLIHHTRLAATR